MAEKKIEIKIAATGGSQAAAEVRKVGDAVEDIGNAGGNTGLDELRDSMEQVRQRGEELKQEAAELNEEIEQNAKVNNIGRASAIGFAVGGSVLAKTLQEISKGLDSIDIENLRQIEPATAAQVQALRELSDALKDPVSQIQKLISGSTIGEAFGAMNEQLSLNVEAQQAAVDKLTSASREMAARVNDTAKELARANAILDAKDAADAAERDAADAARVRGGAAPEDVRAERAAFNRDKELERINRRLEPEAARVQNLFDSKQQAFGDANRVLAAPGATSEQMGKAALAAAKAASEFEQAKQEYEKALAIAVEQRRGVNARFEGEVGDAAGDKAARIERERRQEEQQRQREEAAARRAQLEAQREEQRTALAGLAGGNEAGVSNRARADGNRVLGDIARDLGNADSAPEIAALGEKIKASQGQLSAAMVAALQKMLAEQQAMVAKIEGLEAQMKQSRAK
jgi:hypothetical protein